MDFGGPPNLATLLDPKGVAKIHRFLVKVLCDISYHIILNTHAHVIKYQVTSVLF